MWVHQNNFSLGRVSPRLRGFFGSEQYSRGCRVLDNAIVNLYGNGVRKRGGTRYISTTLNNGQAILIPFVIPSLGNYVLEIGTSEIRVFKESNNTLSLLSLGAPIVSPYSASQLENLQWAPDPENNRIIICHGDVKQKVITRGDSDSEWTISDFNSRNTGPILIYRGKPFTVRLSDVTAGNNRTFIAQDNLFTSDSVQHIFLVGGGYVRVTSFSNPKEAKVQVFDAEPSQATSARDQLRKTGIFNIALVGKKNPALAVAIYTSIVTLEETSDWTGPFEPGTITADVITFPTAGTYTVGEEFDIDLAGAPFTVADVGRIISLDTGATPAYTTFAIITGFVDTTQVTCTVIEGTVDTATAYTHYTIYTPNDENAFAPTFLTIDGTTGSGLTLESGSAYFTSDHVGGQFFLNGGVVTVTSYTGPTQVEVAVDKDLQRSGITYSWGESYSGATGFPQAVCVHQGRLFFGDSEKFPGRYYGSYALDFNDFTLGGTDDASIHYKISDGRIQSMASMGYLAIGTDEAEFAVGPIDGPIVPSTVGFERQSSYGTEPKQPIFAANNFFFVTRGGKGLRAYTFRTDGIPFESIDIADLISDVFDTTTVKQIAFARTPDPVIFVVMNDGTLWANTYRPENQVTAWSRWNGITVESVAVIPGTGRDVVMFIANRTVGGTKRYIEVYDPDLFFDSAGKGTISSNTITGLSHLEGLALGIRADSIDKGNATVSSGVVTIPNQSGAPSAIETGVRISFRMDPNLPHYEDREGFTFMREIGIGGVRIYFNESIGGEVNFANSSEENHVIDGRVLSTQLDEAPAEFTGWKKIGGLGGSSGIDDYSDDSLDDPVVSITHDRGYPFEILVVATEINKVGN